MSQQHISTPRPPSAQLTSISRSVEMSYSRYRSSVNETGIIGTQGSKSLCEVSGLGVFSLPRGVGKAIVEASPIWGRVFLKKTVMW